MYERALLQRLAFAHRSACTWAEPAHVAARVREPLDGAQPTGWNRKVGRTVMHEFSKGEGAGGFPIYFLGGRVGQA